MIWILHSEESEPIQFLINSIYYEIKTWILSIQYSQCLFYHLLLPPQKAAPLGLYKGLDCPNVSSEDVGNNSP